MKLTELLKDIEMGKVYTDKDRKPFKVNEDHHDKKEGKILLQDISELKSHQSLLFPNSDRKSFREPVP